MQTHLPALLAEEQAADNLYTTHSHHVGFSVLLLQSEN